ncbi:hypothetical protein ACFLV7_13125 [Chloroflexota bacterium]
MKVRPFEWRDLPILHRHRHHSIFLDNALVLTRGSLLVPGALLSYLAPTMGVFTCVSNGGSQEDPLLIGQAIHTQGSQCAHLTFLTPEAALRPPMVSGLLEYLVILSGERGAQRVIADVDEQTVAFDALQGEHFVVYSRQRIWKFHDHPEMESKPSSWRTAMSMDSIAIRSLYNNLVPGLVQQVEPYAAYSPQGLVLYQGAELFAYVELKFGLRGIWAKPFVHPGAEGVPAHFQSLLHKIPTRFSRPVYICVRSYQSWLESALEELGAEAGPRQALMGRHMAIVQKAEIRNATSALDRGHAEATSPITRLKSN